MAVVTSLVVTLLLAGGAGWLYDTGRLNRLICAGPCGAQYASAPRGLDSLHPRAVGADAPLPSSMNPAAVTAALAPVLARARLGGHVGMAVSDLSGHLVRLGASDGFLPASTTKLLTGFAALRTLKPQHRFVTRAALDGDRVVLIGGGDPYLASAHSRNAPRVEHADLRTLARRTATALRVLDERSVSIGYDDSLFSGPAFNPAWDPGYLRDAVVSPIGALWADQGVHGDRVDADPARYAAERFAAELRRQGLRVAAGTPRVRVPPNVTDVASVRSATVAEIVENVELYSDNEGAEVLARQAALASGGKPSFKGAVHAVLGQLSAAGIDTRAVALVDGSGLSRADRIPPSVLTQVVVRAARTPDAAALLADLPVAQVSGSLAGRFRRQPAAWGMVHAKTGTLTQVHALSGLVTTRDGQLLAFTAMADSTPPDRSVAEAWLDALAGALAACACRS